jgi:gas vesicle protein
MSGGRFFTGLVLGATLGAAAGALLSPRSGDENRARLTDDIAGLEPGQADVLERLKAEVQRRVEIGKAAYRQAAEETRIRMERELRRARGEEPVPTGSTS